MVAMSQRSTSPERRAHAKTFPLGDIDRADTCNLKGTTRAQFPLLTSHSLQLRSSLPVPETRLMYDEHFTIDQGESDRLYAELRGHAGPVYWVCVKGSHALSVSHDGSVALWDLQTDRE